MQDRATIVHENFLRRVAEGDLPDAKTPIDESGLTPEQAVEIFESQILSRQLDNISRKLQAKGEGFYTIGSAGHEGNAAIAAAFQLKDMAFLHYRDAAFFIQRSKQSAGSTPLWDMLLSFTTSAEDPISGGRHKVLGSKKLNIPPQTSTIASHLPKAVGAAHSIGLNKRMNRQGSLAEDSVILCSFGDASFNHSTAQGAINTASWTSYQNIPLPLVFICEDNGIGISVQTPADWVKASISAKPAIRYIPCNGLDIFDTYRAANEAANYSRKTRKPAFLHMRCVRLFGHAGPDAQHMYLSPEKIRQDEANDPLLHSAALLINNNILKKEQILKLYNEIGQRVEKAAEEVIKRPKMHTAEEIMSSIIPPRREKKATPTPNKIRDQIFADDKALMDKPQHMAKLLSWALTDLMLDNENIILAGEDVGKKGGVYTVTQKIQSRFGAHRVIDTLLDEQSILGLAIGAAHNDIIPIPEIQFLAYLHNAEDQLRGEAATLSFFSKGQFTNPMVIRIAGLGYQKGFGGHFHNDNALAVLRDIPGLIIACPSNGADAVNMLREAIRLAREEQRITVFLEPIALYMTRDLHEEKDNLWASFYEPPEKSTPIKCGDINVHGTGTDLCIISYGSGYYLSRQAAKILEEKHNLKIKIIDLRWLAPLNEAAILKQADSCRNILVIDECRKTASLSETLITLLEEHLPKEKNIARHAAEDSFIPLGRTATITMPSAESIIQNALKLIKKRKNQKVK